MAQLQTIQLDEGWNILLEEGISRLEYFLNTGDIPAGAPMVTEPGKPARIFTVDDYSRLYTYVIISISQPSS
jgi:hypothetical protein